VPSQHASIVYFCLFDPGGTTETHRFALTRSGNIHAAILPNVKPGARYGLRADGPWDPRSAQRFDVSKVLVDPYASLLDRPYVYHPTLTEPGRDTGAIVPKAIVQKPAPKVVRRKPRSPGWIYELPVKAFTQQHPEVPEHLRGTISALGEPAALAYFKRLGVDTIELMPLMAWIDERHLHALDLRNAWGYNPVTFFAPDLRLAPGGLSEIAQTVKKLHDNGQQVILDVVLNHTGESDASGPTLSFRGLDNATWYRHINGAPVNDTGCGNTVALNHPVVVDYTVAALRHWVETTGLDGFRFDLATIMGRTATGFAADAPLIRQICSDPVLSDCILIAEPWDVGPGGYQLGHFPRAWSEWNDRYRDDVRRFWRGDDFSVNALATRLTGSSDVFARKSPARSINFIAAHDGFTLRDLTTCTEKNNFANGEGNRDGKSHEVTWIGGDVRALLATLFLSRGTPLLTAGDEFGRTQNGNNNAYAQDNEITWLDWKNADQALITFTADLVTLRKNNPLLSQDVFLTGRGDAMWFDQDGKPQDWDRPHGRFLGLALLDRSNTLAIAANGSDAALPFPLQGTWKRLFGSADGAGCPPRSICLFQKIER
jgi:glycogen debranching enzyme